MKVLLKILKKNVRNSIVCFMSTILAAIILFVFLGVKELVLGTMSMEERVRSQQGVAIQTYMYILLFIGLILISYTVSNYSRIRIKDYGMFMVFGEEKKDIIRMIILEYGIISGSSTKPKVTKTSSESTLLPASKYNVSGNGGIQISANFLIPSLLQ